MTGTLNFLTLVRWSELISLTLSTDQKWQKMMARTTQYKDLDAKLSLSECYENFIYKCQCINESTHRSEKKVMAAAAAIKKLEYFSWETGSSYMIGINHFSKYHFYFNLRKRRFRTMFFHQ